MQVKFRRSSATIFWLMRGSDVQGRVNYARMVSPDGINRMRRRRHSCYFDSGLRQEKITIDELISQQPGTSRKAMERYAKGKEFLTAVDILEMPLLPMDRIWNVMLPAFFSATQMHDIAREFSRLPPKTPPERPHDIANPRDIAVALWASTKALRDAEDRAVSHWKATRNARAGFGMQAHCLSLEDTKRNAVKREIARQIDTLRKVAAE